MKSAIGNLRGRLMMLIALVSLPALAFVLYAASAERAAARAKVEADALSLARLASREHARQILGASNVLGALSAQASDWGDPSRPCPDYFPALLRGYPHFANLGVLTPGGKLSCSVAPSEGPIDMSRTEAFERSLRSTRVEVGDYQVGLIVHRPVLILAQAVRGEGGEVRAVLFIALELRWFGQLVEEAELPAGSTFSLVDRNGTVLAHSLDAERRVGTRLSELQGPPSSGLGQPGVRASADERGVPRLFALAPLAAVPGVSVALSIPRELAFGPANRQLLTRLLGLLLTALAIAGASSFGAWWFVLRGVRALIAAARQLGAGRLEGRAPERTGVGELDELARTFNAMADALAQREEGLRALSGRIHGAREEEAARIARDLHDDLGQALTALKLDLAWAGPKDPRLAELGARVDGLIERVRRIASELRPGVLDKLGLGAAIEWQAKELQSRTGLALELELGPLRRAYSPEATTAAFRIFQEALTNVCRHAGARRVRVRLEEEGGGLLLSIGDDGRGLPAQLEHAPGSLGIMGMRERARLAGGSVSLKSAPGGGTTVTVRVPEVPS